jgi:hypothetical protein
MKRLRSAGIVIGSLVIAAAFVSLRWASTTTRAADDWPPISAETRPWTRWWWMGSAVTPADITAELEALRNAGIGGVEITPIYGVHGHEESFVDFLSPEWIGLLEHTLDEARRLGLGVDMATGTGWPFGGPSVGNDDACRNLELRTYTVRAGERLDQPVQTRQEPLLRPVRAEVYQTVGIYKLPGQTTTSGQPAPQRGRRLQISDLIDPIEANTNLQELAIDQVRFPRALPLITLTGYSDAGEVLDLTDRVRPDGNLDWVAPSGTWTLYAVFLGWHGKLVERAALGGEGNVIDHFAVGPIRNYLAHFDRAFAGRRLAGLRAFFNDSYEVDDAAGQSDWTPQLFEQFQARRGYDLRRHLPALREAAAGAAAPGGTSARVLADYRETISDLLLETFTTEWAAWARKRGAIVRNQAHGSPANLLDLYAASDIPETEGTDIQRFKWASSAAHIAGRRLIAAEAATWLNEHFRSSLGDIRRALDEFFLGGVNHIVYHGTNYSPREEAWPGWLFYAAVHFNDRNSWWGDFPALNTYVTRVQSFLQIGRPDHDVLLYYPEYDVLAVPGRRGLLEHFGGGETVSRGTPFDLAAETLHARGVTYDFISDRQLAALRLAEGRLRTGDMAYRTILVPQSRYVHLHTFERLVQLATEGATVLFNGSLPDDVAGLADLDARRSRYRELRDGLRIGEPDADGIREARVGAGRFLIGADAERLLARAAVRREPMTDQGLQFVRRVHDAGQLYLVVNRGEALVDGWVPFATSARSATLFDPMHGGRGLAATRTAGRDTFELYLQLRPGESVIVAASGASAGGERYPSYAEAGAPQAVPGPWRLEFVSGGPTLPSSTSVERPGSWTELPGEDVKRFSGTAVYAVQFLGPATRAEAWRLELGRVAHSARVRLNGEEIGVLIGPSYSLVIAGDRLGPSNALAVHVSNLMANRVADLDRQGVPWKKFYNINFPARLPENRGPDNLFTAAGWAPLESGLIGPVTLTPLRMVTVKEP